MSYARTRSTFTMPNIRVTIVLLLGAISGQARKSTSTSCSFCTRGDITEPDKLLSVPDFAFVDTCGYLDHAVAVLLEEDDPQCQRLQALSTYCGCPPPEDSCTFCPDGSPVGDPDKEVPWLADVFNGNIPTCELVEAWLAGLPTMDDSCSSMRLLSAYCGCAARPDHCEFCPGETLKEEYYNVELSGGLRSSCELYFMAQYQLSRDDSQCDQSKLVVHNCGCNDGFLPYYGTSTVGQQAALVWIPRVVAFLSLVASSLIFYHILRTKSKGKRLSMYHQMMLMIATFDAITSLVWLVGTSAIQEYSDTGHPWGIYGAKGNNATCTASGFFLQLGMCFYSRSG